MGTFSFFVWLMARTNKRGIAAKKAAAQKQAKRIAGSKRFDYPKKKLELQEAKDLNIVGVVTNPKGRTYHRFLKGRKICRETRLRVDADGYRYVVLPSWSTDIVEVPQSGWVRKKLINVAKAKK